MQKAETMLQYPYVSSVCNFFNSWDSENYL